MSFANTQSEHRRLAILKHLAACSSYTSNASILQDVLNGVGIRSSREEVMRDLVWLGEKALVEIVDHEDFVIATATGRGCEVARGELAMDGVKRPRPGR